MRKGPEGPFVVAVSRCRQTRLVQQILLILIVLPNEKSTIYYVELEVGLIVVKYDWFYIFLDLERRNRL